MMEQIGVLTIFLILFSECKALVIPEKPMVVGICSYNNARWYKENLDSVFNQEYQNFHITYIDDASDDGTADLVEEYTEKMNQKNRVTLIRNKERRLALANHYRIIHSCKDNEIIVSLDGDDKFAHNKVLKKINEVYQRKGVWLAWSQFRRWPSGKLGYSRSVPSKVIKKNNFRSYPWVWGQTRTYYAWLAKSIKLKDFIMHEKNEFCGRFFPSSCDVALMFPMLEMASNRIAFIPEPLYIYNMHDFTDYKVAGKLQGYCNWAMRKLPRYSALKEPYERKINNQQAEGFLFFLTKNNLVKIEKAIQFLQGLKQIHVFSEEGKISGFETYKNIIWYQTDQEIIDALRLSIKNKGIPYVVVATENAVLPEELSVSAMIEILHMTHGHGWLFDTITSAGLYDYFYFNDKTIFFLPMGLSETHPYNAPGFLLEKKKLDFVIETSISSIQDMFNAFSYIDYDKRDIGLYSQLRS